MKYTKEILEHLACDSTCMSNLMEKAGIKKISGGMHAHLSKKIREFGIDISHWQRTTKGRILRPKRKWQDILKKKKKGNTKKDRKYYSEHYWNQELNMNAQNVKYLTGIMVS